MKKLYKVVDVGDELPVENNHVFCYDWLGNMQKAYQNDGVWKDPQGRFIDIREWLAETTIEQVLVDYTFWLRTAKVLRSKTDEENDNLLVEQYIDSKGFVIL